MAKIELAMPYMLANEGGYANVPGDAGGPTNFGVTIHTLSAWLGRVATVAEVKALTVATVTPIYKKFFWDNLGLDSIVDQGCATAIFDMGVNFGPSAASSMVHAACLGRLGHPSVNACPHGTFIPAFVSVVENHYYAIAAANPVDNKFLRGWIARAHRLLGLV